MPLKAGSLKHFVSLEKRTLDQDSNGDPVTVWEEVAKIWADITPLSAREFVQAKSEQSAADARITIRYRAGMNAQMRFVYRGNYYNIHGVLPDADSMMEYITLPVTTGLVQADDGES
jgi:SPP1 family predicted phage head-tail adaptor